MHVAALVCTPTSHEEASLGRLGLECILVAVAVSVQGRFTRLACLDCFSLTNEEAELASACVLTCVLCMLRMIWLALACPLVLLACRSIVPSLLLACRLLDAGQERSLLRLRSKKSRGWADFLCLLMSRTMLLPLHLKPNPLWTGHANQAVWQGHCQSLALG